MSEDIRRALVAAAPGSERVIDGKSIIEITSEQFEQLLKDRPEIAGEMLREMDATGINKENGFVDRREMARYMERNGIKIKDAAQVLSDYNVQHKDPKDPYAREKYTPETAHYDRSPDDPEIRKGRKIIREHGEASDTYMESALALSILLQKEGIRFHNIEGRNIETTPAEKGVLLATHRQVYDKGHYFRDAEAPVVVIPRQSTTKIATEGSGAHKAAHGDEDIRKQSPDREKSRVLPNNLAPERLSQGSSLGMVTPSSPNAAPRVGSTRTAGPS